MAEYYDFNTLLPSLTHFPLSLSLLLNESNHPYFFVLIKPEKNRHESIKRGRSAGKVVVSSGNMTPSSSPQQHPRQNCSFIKSGSSGIRSNLIYSRVVLTRRILFSHREFTARWNERRQMLKLLIARTCASAVRRCQPLTFLRFWPLLSWEFLSLALLRCEQPPEAYTLSK